MAGRRNRSEHQNKAEKRRQQNAKREHTPVAIPGRPKPAVQQAPKIDAQTIVDAMRKDYESKIDLSKTRPGGEKIDEALFSIIEQAMGSVKTKQKKGKVNIAIDNDELKANARPMVDTLAEGLKEAFMAKWIPELMKVFQPVPAATSAVDVPSAEATNAASDATGDAAAVAAEGAAPVESGPARAQFDAIDAVGLAALLLHRKKNPDDQ